MSSDRQAIGDVIAGMEQAAAGLPDGDPRRFFLETYLRTTRAVAKAIASGTFFNDSAWVERLDVAFAGLYLDAYTSWDSDRTAPGPWVETFAAAADPRHLPPLRHVLLAMNAHINFDLPQALLATIEPEEFDDAALVSRRASDHTRIDEILASRVSAEDDELRRVEQPGDRTLLDHLLTPFNRASTRRFLVEARRKVWHNAKLLNMARRQGDPAERLAELEALARARVADLRRPGQVVLRLGRAGFGVQLDAKGMS